ncbi:MAG: ABC transporter permease [Thermodesulfobacteriota bacterium]
MNEAIPRSDWLESYRYKLKDSIVLPPLIGLVVLFILLAFLSPYFMTIKNVLNILRQISIIGIIAVGMTYVILTGGIDLSVGSMAALSGVVTGLFLKNVGAGVPVSVVAGMIAGLGCGLFNGLLITSRIQMPPFIATLAMMCVARGLALLLTSGRPIFNLPQEFDYFGAGTVLGLPFPIFLMLVVALIAHLNLCGTKTGLYFYAIGGNEEAARVSGIKTNTIKLAAYLISGFCAAVAGILLASRVMVAEPIAGLLYELEAIAAVVIGGADLFGGVGKIGGTLIGAIIMGLIRNGLNLLNVSTYVQQVVIGLVIVAMVSVSILRRK